MKNLLFALLGAATISLSAQDDCVSATGFNDSFDASEAPSDGGTLSLGYWGSEDGVYSFTRNSGDLDVAVNQAFNGWVPMGFSFSELINLTGNTLDVSLTNDGSEGIQVGFSLISNNTTGADAQRITASGTGSLFGGIVPGGSTVTLSFDIANGRKSTWVASSADCIDGTMVGSYCLTDEGFDITKVSGIEWTINGQASAETSWSPPELINHPVTIHSIQSGSCNDDDSDDDDDDDSGDDDDSSGKPCTDLSYSGRATYYNLIEYGNTGKCSFHTPDLQGTYYGALDKGLLQEDGDAKYCGMCVEAIAPDFLNEAITIQIVDECPDCADRDADGNKMYKLDADGNKIIVETTADGPVYEVINTEFGDIDLSPAAFEALIGPLSIGVGSFDWHEVSCPWETPLKVLFASNETWYTKVFIANSVNRIKSVEISNNGGSSWENMTRKPDNGFEKGTYGNDVKSFRITDIYDEVIYVNNINVPSAGPSKTADENFPACGLTTSQYEVNTLDYVVAFPNPANTSIIFDGLEDATSIEILNYSGQVVVPNKDLNKQYSQVSLDISSLAPGIYVAKMTGVQNTGVVTFVKK